MKFSKFIFLSLFLALACSKSDSPQPAIENAKVQTTTVETPSGLTTAANTNTYAQQVLSYTSLANALSGYAATFAVPTTGATKSSTIIKAGNGRVAATSGSTVTYIWSDPQY